MTEQNVRQPGRFTIAVRNIMNMEASGGILLVIATV